MSSSTSSTDGPAGIVVGRVGRPHGLDGSFHVTRPRAELLPAGAVVEVGGTSREVVRRVLNEAMLQSTRDLRSEALVYMKCGKLHFIVSSTAGQFL